MKKVQNSGSLSCCLEEIPAVLLKNISRNEIFGVEICVVLCLLLARGLGALASCEVVGRSVDACWWALKIFHIPTSMFGGQKDTASVPLGTCMAASVTSGSCWPKES